MVRLNCLTGWLFSHSCVKLLHFPSFNTRNSSMLYFNGLFLKFGIEIIFFTLWPYNFIKNICAAFSCAVEICIFIGTYLLVKLLLLIINHTTKWLPFFPRSLFIALKNLWLLSLFYFLCKALWVLYIYFCFKFCHCFLCWASLGFLSIIIGF